MLIIFSIYNSNIMDELKFFHRSRHDAKNAVAVLYFLHGLVDHLGRWLDLKDFLVDRNISFYSHDQRGHGKTELGIRVGLSNQIIVFTMHGRGKGGGGGGAILGGANRRVV